MPKWELTGLRPDWIEVEIGGERYSGREVKDVQAAFRDRLVAAGGRVLPGDEDLVWQAIKDAYPRFVIKNKRKSTDSVSVSAAWSFIQFMVKRLKNRALVSEEEARRRAAICSACPKKGDVLGCGVCTQALKLTVKPPVSLAGQCPRACRACGCYLPLKVWVPRDLLGSEEAFPFWEACWMREPH